MIIDQEQVYQLLIKQQWAELLDFVHKHAKHAANDETLLYALKTFEDQFFNALEQDSINQGNQDHLTLLEKLFLLHKSSIYLLSEDRAQRIIVEIVKTYHQKGALKQAYDYAKFCPEAQICCTIIDQFNSSLNNSALSKTIDHSQSNTIKVTENKHIATNDHTISLFKSQQEIDFFMAVREVFQMYMVYPNVALSCIIDYEKIKEHLTKEEKHFFFRGIIDCIIFDQYNNYKPIQCFELDSIYHDQVEQQIKDGYKDKILALAGKKLYRIRRDKTSQNRTDFIQLIRELI